MIELQTLGSLSLHSDDGEEIRAILVQPKRLALLAYLAVREPGAFVQRSALLPVFWPESDEARARLALRSALHALRAVLGAEAVIGHGDEAIGLDPERIRCDAAELERALAEGRREDAVGLYTGTLLDGLSIGDLPAFDEWLESRRDNLRRRVFDAAMQLASERETAGEYRDALTYLHRAGELMPYDENVIRREMSLLSTLGDRATSITTYEAWAQRLQRDLEVEPSPDTVALAEQLRTQPPVRASALRDWVVLSDATAPASSVPALQRSRLRWRVAALAAVAAVAVIAVVTQWARPGESATMEPSSAAAKAEFARAERLEAAGEYVGAYSAYRRVTQLEPRFARAYYGMSIAAQWAGYSDTAVISARKANEFADRLPPDERASLPAWQALLAPSLGRSAQLYESFLKQYPEHAISWMQLGEIRYHWGSAFGMPASSAIEPFARVLRLQPNNGGAFVHLFRLDGRAMRVAAFDSVVALAARESISSTERLELRALQAALHDDTQERVRVLAEAQGEGPATVLQLCRLVAPIDTGMSLALARALTATKNRPVERAVGYLTLVNAEIARGRFDAARAWIDSFAVGFPVPASEHLAVLATLPWVHPDAPLLRDAVARLDRIPAQHSPSYDLRGDVALPRKEIEENRRLYLKALAYARLGEQGRADSAIATLERMPGDSVETGFNRELAAIVRADWALRDGDAERALRLLGEPGGRMDGSLADLSAYPKARRRFLRAAALAKLGRHLDAANWYSTFPDPSSYDIAYAGPAMLGAAREYALLGNRAVADSLTREARRWNARP